MQQFSNGFNLLSELLGVLLREDCIDAESLAECLARLLHPVLRAVHNAEIVKRARYVWQIGGGVLLRQLSKNLKRFVVGFDRLSRLVLDAVQNAEVVQGLRQSWQI